MPAFIRYSNFELNKRKIDICEIEVTVSALKCSHGAAIAELKGLFFLSLFALFACVCRYFQKYFYCSNKLFSIMDVNGQLF